MARPRKLHLDKDTITNLYSAQGLTVTSIARSLGTTVWAVSRELKECGIEVLPAHRDRRRIDTKEILRLYLEENWSIIQIASQFRCSPGCIRKRLKKSGHIRPNVRSTKPRTRLKVTKEELENEYLKSGKTDLQIANEHGVCIATIVAWRKRYGIRRRKPKNYIDIPVDEIRVLYIDEKWSMEQICRHFGCGESTVRSHLVRNGLQIDPREVNQRRLEKNKKLYKGVRIVSGYRVLLMREHPEADKDGYVREHRLMAEKYVCRPLERTEQVHHINFDKLDNGEENLAVLESRKVHTAVHTYMSRLCIYRCGYAIKPPKPLSFSKPTFWGGKYITELDLLDNSSELGVNRLSVMKGDVGPSVAIN